VDFIVDDAPAGQACFRAGAGLRVAVGEDADVVAGGPQRPGEEAEELGVSPGITFLPQHLGGAVAAL
jgi:hypothetical protein